MWRKKLVYPNSTGKDVRVIVVSGVKIGGATVLLLLM